MNDIYDLAINSEVRKIAFRQTKEGIVVSFLIHPNEVPDELVTASLGTRYMMALVEIGDNEEPAEPGSGRDLALDNKTTISWDKLSYVARAGIMCRELAFLRFLQEAYGLDDEKKAASAVRQICGVDSRSEIRKETPAGDRWRDLESEYRAWLLKAKVVQDHGR